MDPKECIGHISGGRVLDIATGNGGFIRFLLEGLRDYEEIVGIDTREKPGSSFAKAFAGQAVCYRRMDAARLDFVDGSFDTVSISNSLHHMQDLACTLSEMMRVLKAGGYLILSEMYRDNQSETQMTHVHLHHWWAAVDRTQGICHHETFRCEEIVEMVAGLHLEELRVHDLAELQEDPFDPGTMAELLPVIDSYLARARRYPELVARGEELRRRLETVGFDGANTLLVTGRKPAGA